jgi:hypothetical protein
VVAISCLVVSGAYAGSPLQNAKLELRREVDRLARENVGARHFAFFFAFEGPGNRARDSHTFAAFVERGPSGAQIWRSISWLPVDLRDGADLCVFENLREAALFELWGRHCEPEAGENFSLEETLLLAALTNKSIFVSEALVVSREYFEAFSLRRRFLESQALGYVADDRRNRRFQDAANCIHAISDVAGIRIRQGGLLGTGFGLWGRKGTLHVLKEIQRLRPQWILKGNTSNLRNLAIPPK